MKFSEMFSLKKRISIYVPSTVNVNENIDNKIYVEKTACFLSDLFGGSTSVNASGNWVSGDIGLVSENVTIVYSYCSKSDFDQYENDIILFVKKLCSEMKQECISCEIDNNLYFVD